MSRAGRGGYLNTLGVGGTHIERNLNDVFVVIMNMHWRYFLPLHLLLLLLLLLHIYILDIGIVIGASQVILGHLDDLRLLALATKGRTDTILMQDLLVNLLVVLNLVRYLGQIYDFLSLVSCRIRLTSWWCRNISMMKLIVRALPHR